MKHESEALLEDKVETGEVADRIAGLSATGHTDLRTEYDAANDLVSIYGFPPPKAPAADQADPSFIGTAGKLADKANEKALHPLKAHDCFEVNRLAGGSYIIQVWDEDTNRRHHQAFTDGGSLIAYLADGLGFEHPDSRLVRIVAKIGMTLSDRLIAAHEALKALTYPLDDGRYFTGLGGDSDVTSIVAPVLRGPTDSKAPSKAADGVPASKPQSPTEHARQASAPAAGSFSGVGSCSAPMPDLEGLKRAYEDKHKRVAESFKTFSASEMASTAEPDPFFPDHPAAKEESTANE